LNLITTLAFNFTIWSSRFTSGCSSWRQPSCR